VRNLTTESRAVAVLCSRRESGTQKENGALSYRSIHDLQWVGGVGHGLLGRCGGEGRGVILMHVRVSKKRQGP